jgi:hypothetical protein
MRVEVQHRVAEIQRAQSSVSAVSPYLGVIPQPHLRSVSPGLPVTGRVKDPTHFHLSVIIFHLIHVYSGMIVYNVTIQVENTIAREWLDWLRAEHIPEMISTGCFTKAQVHRLLETDETEGRTYAVQYYANSRDLYNRYIEKFSDALRKKGIEKWGNRFIAFRSVMELVD